jgi:hypothetical protein
LRERAETLTMIAERSGNFSGLERYALRTARLLVRAGIVLQIQKFQSASRAKQRVIAAALAMIGLFAGTLGLLLQAGEGLKHAPSTFKRTDWEPVLEEGAGVFANSSSTRGSRMIREHV